MTRRIFTSRPYGKLIQSHILETPRCGVWAGMGMGKTVETLNALDILELVEPGPTLVCAPLRVAQSTWPDEVAKWEHLRNVEVVPIIGDARARARTLARAYLPSASIFTINYENLPWLEEILKRERMRWPFRRIVSDESTKLKGWRGSKQVSKAGKEFVRGAGAQRSRVLARVAFAHAQRFIELTGTPSPNGLQDLWGQAWFLDQGARLGRTFDSFNQRWFRPKHNGYGTEPLPHAQGEIQARMRDLCLSLDPRDWFDLHEPVRNVIHVHLPAKARALYDDMERKMFAEIAGHPVEAFNAAAKSMKCLQLANGAAYVDENAEAWVEVHDAKLQALESIVEEAAGMPVLVGYQFRSDLARLQMTFPDGIHLGTSEGLREAKRGKGRVWFGHPASMGHGVDGLQEHTNIAAFFGTGWNLELHLQFIERIGATRQMQAGKDRPVFLHYLVARDTVDELALARMETKREVQDLLLEAMKRRGYQ